MTLQSQNLTDLSLTRVGSFKVTDNGLVPICFLAMAENEKAKPCAYVFCVEKKENGALEVFYVGKAGKGITERMNQHHHGFMDKKLKNKKHTLGDALRKRQSHDIHIWARQSGDVEFEITKTNKLNLPDLDLLELGLIELLRSSYDQPLVNKGDIISRGGVK